MSSLSGPTYDTHPQTFDGPWWDRVEEPTFGPPPPFIVEIRRRYSDRDESLNAGYSPLR